MRRFACGLCVLLFLWLLPSGCGDAPLDTGALAMRMRELPLPVGSIYHSEAAEWEAEHLPDAIFSVLLGQKTGAEGQPKYRDFCVYLSADGETVAEAVIASCYTTADAEDLAARLSLRLAFLRGTLGDGALSDAEVRLSSRTVLYLATPCNGALLDACR